MVDADLVLATTGRYVRAFTPDGGHAGVVYAAVGTVAGPVAGDTS